jgi:hypothetical protein
MLLATCKMTDNDYAEEGGLPSLPPFTINQSEEEVDNNDNKNKETLKHLSNLDIALDLGNFCLKYNRYDLESYVNNQHVYNEPFITGLYKIVTNGEFSELYEKLLSFLLIFDEKIHKLKLIWEVSNKISVEEQINVVDNEITIKDLLICLERIKIHWYNIVNNNQSESESATSKTELQCLLQPSKAPKAPKTEFNVGIEYSDLNISSCLINNDTVTIYVKFEHKLYPIYKN